MRVNLYRPLSLFLFLLIVIPMSVAAQQIAPVFVLPDAHAGQGYRVEIENVLRDKYRLKLESGAPGAIIQWMLVAGAGDLPAGLSLRTDGTIIGEPAASSAEAYCLRLKAVDVSAPDEELQLDFSIAVKAGRLRLSKVEGPRLVPIDMRSPTVDNVTLVQSIEPSAKRDDAQMSAHASGAPANLKTGNAKPDPEVAVVRAPGPKNADREAIQNPFSSMNRRLIVGVEQSGAASAESKGNPFFDLFISTPLSRSDTGLTRPRFSIWGDVRLTTSPEQIAAFADVSSNAIDSIRGGKLNKLSQGFDFVVGPEIRLQQFNHTDVSLIGAFGAISPLSPKESAQIFQVPDAASSQAAAFFQKYPGAVGKQYIAFVAPDRDRFLRQYYAGFRFKTYSYDGSQLQDVFPSMLDITFGQSEAVTGGRLHKFVVGIDGFYPLPFPDKRRFLYLFGTAKFKAGGPKNNSTPFILDTAASSIGITDPKVFIANPTPTNRDYYRIGFGVDLIELFKFAQDKK